MAAWLNTVSRDHVPRRRSPPVRSSSRWTSSRTGAPGASCFGAASSRLARRSSTASRGRWGRRGESV